MFINSIYTCEGGERKPARVFSVKPARKMISNIDYPIISHLSNMPTFFWAKTRQIRGADTPRGRNVPGKEAGQRQTKWHTVWCAISICHTWPRRWQIGLGEKVGQGQTKWHTVRYAVSSCHTWPKITAAWPGWIRASDRNAPYQNCLVVQTAARHSKPPP